MLLPPGRWDSDDPEPPEANASYEELAAYLSRLENYSNDAYRFFLKNRTKEKVDIWEEFTTTFSLIGIYKLSIVSLLKWRDIVI